MNFVSKLEYGERNLLNEVDVTILMPIFNHNKYLLESIESALRNFKITSAYLPYSSGSSINIQYP